MADTSTVIATGVLSVRMAEQREARWSHYEDLPQNERLQDVFTDYWTASRELGSGDLDLIVLRVSPGEGGKPHAHADPVEECYLVLEGTVDVQLADDLVTVDAGTVFYFPPGVTHHMINNSDEPALVASFRTLDDGDSKPIMADDDS